MSTPTSRPLHILLVEDNEDDVAITRIALTRLDVPVILSVAETGPSGLAKICSDSEPPVDLVLLDINLPLMNGLDVLTHATEARGSRCMPILVLSTSSTTEETSEAMRRGASAYHSKPFRLDEYTALLREIVDTYAPRSDSPRETEREKRPDRGREPPR